jgi:hypothetical protein
MKFAEAPPKRSAEARHARSKEATELAGPGLPASCADRVRIATGGIAHGF